MAVRFSSIVDAQSGIRALHINTSRINLNYGWALSSSGSGTKLTYAELGTAACVLRPNTNFSGIVVSGIDTLYTDNVETRKFVAERATIVGTLAADTLKANTLDVSNLDFSDTTLDVSNISVSGSAEIDTLSAVQVLAEQGAMEQLTVSATLDANRAVLSELTVLQTLHAGTIKARELAVDEELSANTITASFLNVDGWIDAKSLTVNGVPIMGGGSSGDDSGDDISTDLAVDSVTATKYVEVLGTTADKGIVLDTEDGLQLGTGASLTIRNLYDASVDPYVTIDVAGVKAATIHGNTVKGALIQGTTIQGQTVTGTTINATNLTAESMSSETLQAVTLTVDDTITSQELDTSILVADQLSANFLNIANSLQVQPSSDESPSFSITTDNANQAALSLTGSAVIDGSLSVTSLKVNGVDITDNGGEIELPPTIQVSEVQALSEGAAVSIPQMQGNELRLNGELDGPSPTGYLPLGLHIRLSRSVAGAAADIIKTTVTVLSAETEFREPVLFRPELGETQIKSLDSANFEQCTVVNTGLYYAPTIDAKASGVLLSPKELAYSERAWVETRPALVNSTSDERAIITLGADRALSLAEELSEIAETVNGYGLEFLRVDSAAFTLTSESITTRAAFQLPFNSDHLGTISVQNADGSITYPTPASTELLYAAEVKTNVSPSQFDVEATATLATYETITTADLTYYIDNTKARFQLDVSPAAYASNLNYVAETKPADDIRSGVYVRPNNVIIQAPFDQTTNASYVAPANPEQMGVGLYGRNIVLDAESAIKLEAATSVVGALYVSDLVKANTASVVGSLSAKSLYVNGVQITGSTGGNDAEFTTVTTGTVRSDSSLNLAAPSNLTINSTAAGISLMAGATDQLYCKARIAIGASNNIVLDHVEGEKVIIDERNRSTGAITPHGGTLQLGTLIAGAGETTVIDSSQFDPSGTSGGLKNNKIIIGSSSARIISCIEWNAGDGDLLSYLQSNEGLKTCVPMHFLFQIFQLKPELQASTTTT